MPPFTMPAAAGTDRLNEPARPEENRPLNTAPCRDCGLVIDLDSRGCPMCARNLDAERGVAKLLLGAAALLALAAALAAYLLLRG